MSNLFNTNSDLTPFFSVTSPLEIEFLVYIFGEFIHTHLYDNLDSTKKKLISTWFVNLSKSLESYCDEAY